MSSRRTHVDLSVQTAFPPSYRAAVSRAARAAADAVSKTAWKSMRGASPRASVTVSIVGKAASRKLNRRFRGKDKPTDVLSFPSATVPGSDFVGDVIVCWPVALEQTEAFDTTPKQEAQRLVVHGVLHLFGYDHETSQADARRMFRLQNQVLRKLFTRG